MTKQNELTKLKEVVRVLEEEKCQEKYVQPFRDKIKDLEMEIKNAN